MTILAVCALLGMALLAWLLKRERSEAAKWEEVARAAERARKHTQSLLRTRRYVDKVMRDERRKSERREGLSLCRKFGHAIPNRDGERVCGRCERSEEEIEIDGGGP